MSTSETAETEKND